MKRINGYPDYAVTKIGEIMSIRYNRFLKPGQNKKGYLTVNLCNTNGAKTHTIHKLVLETFVGLRPPRMQCRHLDNNPANNKLDNLCWGTPQENQADRIKHGTSNRGEQQGRVKLRTIEVFEIRKYYESGEYTQRELAEKFGVHQSNISCIVRKKSWKHI